MTTNSLGTPTAVGSAVAAARPFGPGSAEAVDPVVRLGSQDPPTGARRRIAGLARRRTSLATASVLLVLAAWQLSGLYMDKIFISTPTAVASQFFRLVKNGSLTTAFLHSAWEMMVGFGIAAAVGISLGLAMGRTRWLDRALDPWVSFANAAPAIAVLPVLEIWFGFGVFARISFVTVLAIWTMTINTLVGTKNVGRVYGDVSKAFGLRGIRAIRKIFLPAAMPYILAGSRVALAQAAVGMILSGQEIGQSGLGGLAEDYASFYETSSLIATIITSTGLAICAFSLLRLLQRHFFPWISATTAQRAE